MIPRSIFYTDIIAVFIFLGILDFAFIPKFPPERRPANHTIEDSKRSNRFIAEYELAGVTHYSLETNREDNFYDDIEYAFMEKPDLYYRVRDWVNNPGLLVVKFKGHDNVNLTSDLNSLYDMDNTTDTVKFYRYHGNGILTTYALVPKKWFPLFFYTYPYMLKKILRFDEKIRRVIYYYTFKYRLSSIFQDIALACCFIGIPFFIIYFFYDIIYNYL